MKRRIFAPLLAALLSLALLLPALAQTGGPTTFLETFDTDAGSPTPYRPAGWDVSKISHDDDTIDGMWAEHGPNCEPPDEQWTEGTQPRPETNHFIHTAPEMVFSCRDHLMMAANAGYAAIYLTPPVMMDFRNGPATFEWDMSTQRTSSRDWIDVVLMPFAPERTDLQGPMAFNFADFHTPRDALQIELAGGGNVLIAATFLDHEPSGCSGSGSYWRRDIYQCHLSNETGKGWDAMLAAYGLKTSAARRDRFRIEVTTSHLKVGFRPTPNAPYTYWIDTEIPGGLRFNEAVVQLNQRVYNPLKPCADTLGTAAHAGEPGAQDGWEGDCRANTWHVDNVSISPATPFTILPGVRRISQPGGSVTFPLPAPPNSFLKAGGGWSDTEFSIDAGRTWKTLSIVGPKGQPEQGDSYWEPIPEGVQTVQFRGSDPRWSIQDIYLYSRTARDAAPMPTVVATPPATPTLEPLTPTPGATRTPTATVDASPTVGISQTVTPTLGVTPITPNPTPLETPIPGGSATPTVGTSQTPTATPEATPALTPTATPTPCEIVVMVGGIEVGRVPC